MSEDKKLKESLMINKEDPDIRTCIKCGRFFRYMGVERLYCPICMKQDQKEFNKVKEYIYEHGRANMQEIHEETGVSYAAINFYLREGRLEIPENSPIFIKCEMCGTDIRSGRLCSQCATKLSNAMRMKLNFNDYQVGEQPKKNKKEGKMRFLNTRDK